MKKLLSVAALLAMLTLASCNKGTAPESTNSGSETPSVEVSTGSDTPAAE
jgi:hypothetical protein